MSFSVQERWVLGILGFLVLVVFALTWWSDAHPPAVSVVPPAPAAANRTLGPAAPALKRLTVHVAGAVIHPGLVQLREGQRVWDAIQAAGGATPEGRPDVLNLAALVQDGERVQVPTRAEVAQALAGGAGWQPAASWGEATPPGPVDLNHATEAQIDALPGVGPTLAQRIVVYRTEHGVFKRLEDLLNVSGIGPKVLERLKDRIVLR